MLSYRFRWVYCLLEILRQCLPPSVRRILDELPETLDETYGRVLKDIKKVNREHAIRLLHCLTIAIRPLRVEELAEILIIDFDAARREGIPKLNPNWRLPDQHQAVLSTCSSLIAIVDDGDSQVVQFSHFSVKEYLTSDRLANANGDVSRYHILPESAHTILAQACLGVLLCFNDHVDEDTAKGIPLAMYAAGHWVEHAQFKDVSSRIRDAMEYFFDGDKPHFAAWHEVHDVDDGWIHDDNFIRHGGPLYYASLCGFYDLAKHLVVKHPEHVNARGGQMASPLGAALFGKHLQVVELLYEHGADVRVPCNKKWTLLHLASLFGSVDAARWLLNHGADANAQTFRHDGGWSPLLLAAWSKRPEIVQMLLEHHTDIHARNARGEVALHLAACYWNWLVDPHYQFNLNILRLLLDHGADVNTKDNEGSTPLHHSSFRNMIKDDIIYSCSGKGSIEGTRLLLEHGANVDAENNQGYTPFLVALEAGHHEMAEFLWGLGTMLA
jgi:ankyrin repeat protein